MMAECVDQYVQSMNVAAAEYLNTDKAAADLIRKG